MLSFSGLSHPRPLHWHQGLDTTRPKPQRSIPATKKSLKNGEGRISPTAKSRSRHVSRRESAQHKPPGNNSIQDPAYQCARAGFNPWFLVSG